MSVWHGMWPRYCQCQVYSEAVNGQSAMEKCSCTRGGMHEVIWNEIDCFTLDGLGKWYLSIVELECVNRLNVMSEAECFLCIPRLLIPRHAHISIYYLIASFKESHKRADGAPLNWTIFNKLRSPVSARKKPFAIYIYRI